MAISIDWVPAIIRVPRADMPIVQASPEIRELDVDAFRLALKNLEASVDGMPWPDTHRHVTETTLSGTVYARIVQILVPYTIEFEDGQYAVRTTGANHNILDVKIANQVSLLVQNSAGLINAPTIDAIAADLALVAVDAALARVESTLARKHLGNRLEVDVAAQELVLWDDDHVTVLQRWSIATHGGEPVQTTAGIQTKRGAPQL